MGEGEVSGMGVGGRGYDALRPLSKREAWRFLALSNLGLVTCEVRGPIRWLISLETGGI